MLSTTLDLTAFLSFFIGNLGRYQDRYPRSDQGIHGWQLGICVAELFPPLPHTKALSNEFISSSPGCCLTGCAAPCRTSSILFRAALWLADRLGTASAWLPRSSLGGNVEMTPVLVGRWFSPRRTIMFLGRFSGLSRENAALWNIGYLGYGDASPPLHFLC